MAAKPVGRLIALCQEPWPALTTSSYNQTAMHCNARELHEAAVVDVGGRKDTPCTHVVQVQEVHAEYLARSFRIFGRREIMPQLAVLLCKVPDVLQPGETCLVIKILPSLNTPSCRPRNWARDNPRFSVFAISDLTVNLFCSRAMWSRNSTFDICSVACHAECCFLAPALR